MKLFATIYLLGCLPLSGLVIPGNTTPYRNIAKISISRHVADSSYSTTGLFVPGTQPKLISKQFEFTEGPAADNQGNVFFTDQPNNAIWKYDVNGKLSKFTDSAGRSNGMYFDRKGNLVTCADGDNQIWRFNKKGKRTAILLFDIDDKKFNGPNDLWMPKAAFILQTLFINDHTGHATVPNWTGKKCIIYLLAVGKSELPALNCKSLMVFPVPAMASICLWPI